MARSVRDIVAQLERRRWTIAVAEAACGGLLAARFVAEPGASRVFAGGVVAYSEHAKTFVLGVDPALLERHGAVSAEVAAAMARGAQRAFGAHVGVAESGIAGPAGGKRSPKPVGTLAQAVAIGGSITSSLTDVAASDRARMRGAFVDALLAALREAMAIDP